MRARILLAAATAVTLVSLAPAQAAPRRGQPGGPESSPQPGTRWIVRYRSEGAANEGVHAAGSQVRQRFTHVFPGAVVATDAAGAARLRRQPGVLSVEPDQRIHAADVQVNPPATLDRIDQRTSRQTRSFSNSYTGAGVRIYVVDSGINTSHVDFAGRITSGRNTVGGTTVQDDYGHGTHVAGIAAGTRMGVAKKAAIVPVKVLDRYGGGSVSQAITGLDWVLQQHQANHIPSVVNLSLDGPVSDSLDAAVTRLVAAGITVVSAAGNQAGDACQNSPARVPAAITVANADIHGWPASDTNRGRCVDLYAPGQWVTSDYIGSRTATAVMNGTSMAAPLVAGEAALVLQARPSWTPTQVTSEILGKATRNAILKNLAGTPNRMLYTSGGVTPGMVEKAGTPTITGTPAVGRTLVGNPGAWGNGTVRLVFGWYRVDSRGVRRAISGQTGTRHAVTTADRGSRLEFRVTGSKPDYASRTRYSAPTGVVR